MKIDIDPDLNLHDSEKVALLSNAQRALDTVKALDPRSVAALENGLQHTKQKDTLIIHGDHHLPNPSLGIPVPRSVIDNKYDPHFASLLSHIRGHAIQNGLKLLNEGGNGNAAGVASGNVGDSSNGSNPNSEGVGIASEGLGAARFALQKLLENSLKDISNNPGDMRSALADLANQNLLGGHTTTTLAQTTPENLALLYRRSISDPTLGPTFKKYISDAAGKMLNTKARNLPNTVGVDNIPKLIYNKDEGNLIEALRALAQLPKQSKGINSAAKQPN